MTAETSIDRQSVYPTSSIAGLTLGIEAMGARKATSRSTSGRDAATAPAEDSARAPLAPRRQNLVVEVVKGPSKGKVFRPGPNQEHLSVGRTKASLIHVKSPGVSEKHAEVS